MRIAIRTIHVASVFSLTFSAWAAIPLGTRLELFVAVFLIERFEGAALKLHEPTPAGVALRFDRPW